MPLTAQAADPLPRGKPEEVGMSSERLAVIGKAVNAEIARDQLPGAVLAIARRGQARLFRDLRLTKQLRPTRRRNSFPRPAARR
jgi:hypothetical protein